MSKPLRVLMVEDSEDDVLLTILALNKGGYESEYTRVETAEAMRKALGEKTWDVVLCDYRMPKFNGLAAIALLKETAMDIPFIIVSGAIGEETAVECMRAGAHDYVMKNNLPRLAAAIEREMKEAESRSQRRRAEEMLKKSELEKTAILESMMELVAYQNMDMEILWTNRAAAESVGLTEEELVGRRCYEVWHQRSEPCVGCPVVIARETGRPQSSEMVTPDGRIWFVQGHPVLDKEGHIAGVVEVVADITQIKQVEKELRESEERYRLYFENVSDILYTIDKDLNIDSVSPSVEGVLGYKPEDFIGRPVTALGNILAQESFEQAVADIGLVLQGNAIPATVYRFIAKDGNIKYGEVSGSPVMREGKIIGLISVARDITERKRTEEKLRESEEKYRGILENMDDMYYEVDLKGSLVFFNEAMILQTGYSREELMGLNYRKYQSPEMRQIMFSVFSEIYKTGRPASLFEYEIITKGGQTRNYESWVSLLRDNNNGPIGFRGIARDVTARKNTEKQLRETLDNLRKAVGTTIQVMVSAVEAKDPYTAGHQLRVADLARGIATEMGLSQEQIEGIRMAGSIHDIGKLSVPAEILSKPTKLTDNEFLLVKEHAQKGYEILKDVESSWPLAEIVYQHHERMDGSGYPRKLKGDDILIEARIMAVADVVEAMSSHRPYRPGKGIDAALEEIEKNRGTLYDDAVADACLKLFREKGYKLQQN